MKCIHCHRIIDETARICPYCNWDQGVAPPPPDAPRPQIVTNYVPPEQYDVKKKLGILGVGVMLLIVSFLVGMIINRSDAPKHAPETLAEQAAEHNVVTAPRRADTPLIPMNERGGYEQPITSAPATTATDGTAAEYSRTDATAASAAEYEQMAKRAKAEKGRMASLVDPRQLTGPAYRPAANTAAANPDASTTTQRRRYSARTRPIPQYQPLPHIYATGTARLTLIVGADGRVTDIDVERALRRDTAKLVESVQAWRFKPATENGEPVAAPYSVEISFKRE